MRFLLAWVLSSTLMLGCGDGGSSGGASGQGGTGAQGGGGGVGGQGGAAGAEPGRAYVLTSPIPPCAQGVASNYSVEIFEEGSRSVSVSFPECSGSIDGEKSTVACPSEEAGLDVVIELSIGGSSELEFMGAFEACSGFLFRDVDLAADEVVVDLFAFPIPPCEAGVPSDYFVEVFVDGAPEPFDVAGNFPDCSGEVDSIRNRITCSNDADTLGYGLIVAEGLDWQVDINGSWETCTAFVAKDSSQKIVR